MSNQWYPKALEAFLSGSIDLLTDTIKAYLVNTSVDYTFSTTHQHLSDVTTYSGVAGVQITTPSVTNGVFDGDDIAFPAVAISGGKHVQAVVIAKDTGTPTTSPLIAYIDTVSGPVALDVTPNGAAIDVTWDNGTDKIAAL